MRTHQFHTRFLGLPFRQLVCSLALLLALPPGVQADKQADGDEASALKPVTQERLVKGASQYTDWLMYGGSYDNARFSPLTDIDRQNVKKLSVAWVFQTGIPYQFQASPIVADGILYVTAAYNHLYALDAATGDPLWKYNHELPKDLRICCGPGNRGVALAEDKVFMGTLDARLVALDRKTGKVIWNVEVGQHRAGFSVTAAPLVVKDKIVVGLAGGEYGIRGYLDAYEVKTGERRWRTYTVPAEGELGSDTWAGDSWKNGGGPTWVTGAYDAEQDLLYWGVGNPAPDWNGDVREGDNLYTSSALALDSETGTIKWHFQFTPHDIWDYDGNTGLMLLDVQHSGKTVKAIAQPNRNGYLYVLDRVTGEYLHGTQYVDQLNWAKGLDEKGRPIVNPEFVPTKEGDKLICPGAPGGQNGSYTAAYSPLTSLMYVPVIESCMEMQKAAAIFVQGIPYLGGGPGATQGDDGSSYGHLSAIDPSTGATKWQYKDEYPLVGGTLATAGGLVFTGNQAGHAMAFDDKTGELLWQFQTGSGVRGQPVTYKLGGRQYIAVPSGGGGLATALLGKSEKVNQGSALVVFALPES